VVHQKECGIDDLTPSVYRASTAINRDKDLKAAILPEQVKTGFSVKK
jgi:hypothetical protein